MKKMMMVLSIMVVAQAAIASDKCIISCERREMYGKSVLVCWYDELVQCERFQPVCRDVGSTVCKPRVVHLGYWTIVPKDEPQLTTTSYQNDPYGVPDAPNHTPGPAYGW